MASKKSTGLKLAGGALVLYLLFGTGKAKAAGPVIKPEIKPAPSDPKPPADDPPPINAPDPEPAEDFGGNWGITPSGLIPEFLKAEAASGIAGFGRFLAVKAWQAARATAPIMAPLEAAAWALAHPTLCQNCQNNNPSEIKASFAGLERVTLPLGQTGPNGGVGAYKAGQTWPMPSDYDSWGNIGSAGLFDFLGSTAVYSGIHDNKFTPLLAYPASILFQVDVQLYCAGYYAYRCFNRKDIPLFSRANGDPVKLWTGLGSCWLSPTGFIANNQSSKDAAQRFADRAKEVGIDLSKLPLPSLMKAVWPGAQAYYTKLGVAP